MCGASKAWQGSVQVLPSRHVRAGRAQRCSPGPLPPLLFSGSLHLAPPSFYCTYFHLENFWRHFPWTFYRGVSRYNLPKIHESWGAGMGAQVLSGVWVY